MIKFFKYTFLLIVGFSCSVLVRANVPGFTFAQKVKSVKIPVDIQHNIILLPMRVNDSFEMNFILDTGVRTTILTETMVASFLLLDSLRRIRVRGLGEGEAIEAVMASNLDMSLPGVIGRGMNMIILPEGIISYSGMFGKPVHGIIGFDLFNQFVIEIDYSNKFIRLHDPFTFKHKHNKKRTIIPIEIRNSKPYVDAQFIDHRGEKIDSQWLLDTGASQAIALFDDDLPLPEPFVEAFLGQGLSGNVYGKLGRGEGFQLAGYYFPDILAGYPDSSSLKLIGDGIGWYGNLGAEVISRFHIIFDYHRSIISVRKNLNYKKPFDYNVSGIEILGLGEDYNEFQICYVRPNSPAFKAGLRLHDEIISLNGISTSSLTIDELYGLLGKRIGKTVQVRVRREGKTHKAKFKLVSEI